MLPKKNVGRKKCGSQNIVIQTKMLVKKRIWVQKIFWVKKKFLSQKKFIICKKILGKKIIVRKNGSENIFGPKFLLGPIKFWV